MLGFKTSMLTSALQVPPAPDASCTPHLPSPLNDDPPLGPLDPAYLHGPTLNWFSEIWAQPSHLDSKCLKDCPSMTYSLLGKAPLAMPVPGFGFP